MNLAVTVSVQAPKREVWAVLIDIENSNKNISSIEKVEVLENPGGFGVGFKWKETRKMYGVECSEVMWITDVVDGESYSTRSESHGAVYDSHMSLSESDGNTTLDLSLGWTCDEDTRKALQKDLEEIKVAVENRRLK